MISQNENRIISSFLLWLDNKILTKGAAYENISGRFYPQTSQFSNYYVYNAPFAQFVYDSSISGATIGTGLYLNSVNITTGQSGFLGINTDRGQAIFSTNQNNYVLSGYFAIKDFNIMLTSDTEETILFKTKYQLRPKFPQMTTGVCTECRTYPMIYVREDGGTNEPFALGGTDTANYSIRCIILADSLYKLNAVQGIMRNTVRTLIPLFEASEMPFNSLGILKSGTYNYTGAAFNKINENNYVFIEKVKIPRRTQSYTVDNKLLNSDIFFNFIDFEISQVGDFRC